MKKLTIMLVGISLSFFLLNPVSAQAATTQNTETTYRTTLLQLIDALQKQIALLQLELIKQNQNVTVGESINNSYQNTILALETYNIIDESSVAKIPDRTKRAYFQRVFDLFPDEYDAKLGRLIVFDGRVQNIDAFVETIPPQNDKWVFAVSDDIIDDTTSADSTELIVHELGHLVSYESVVGVPAPAISDCDNYFNTHGCPSENSYLKQFTNQFWSSSDIARVEQANKTDDPIKEANKYYKTHKSEFVSDYAASAPEEDFSESFMYYILNNQTSGNLAQQKVNFFSRFAEIENIQREIEKNI